METVASSTGEIKHYTSSLHLHNVEDDMAGRYQCVVSNDFGSAFSLRARINVYGKSDHLKENAYIFFAFGNLADI